MFTYIRTAYDNGMESGNYMPLEIIQSDGPEGPFLAALLVAIAKLRAQGIAPTKLFLVTKDWSRMAEDAGHLGDLFDPEVKYENVKNGRLGTLLGLDLYTDGYEDFGILFIKQSVVM